MLTFDGITQPVGDWALDYGIYPAVITDRLSRGWPVEQAITKPMIVAPKQRLTREHMMGLPVTQKRRYPNAKRAKLLCYDGLTLSIPEWGDRLNIPSIRLYKRLSSGWSVERTLSTKIDARAERQLGVVKNLSASSGTGGGSTTQDIP